MLNNSQSRAAESQAPCSILELPEFMDYVRQEHLTQTPSSKWTDNG